MAADDEEHLGDQFRYWHITSRKNFKIDPEHHPNVAVGLGGQTTDPGLYVTDSPMSWSRHPYSSKRKWAAEISVPEKLKMEPIRREAIVDPATASVTRVIPVGEAEAETTGYHPERGSVPRGYRYEEG